jgi:hypothetical protein
MRLITDAGSEALANKCMREVPLDYDGSILRIELEPFVGPPTKAEAYSDLYHSYYDPDCPHTAEELDELLKQFN